MGTEVGLRCVRSPETVAATQASIDFCDFIKDVTKMMRKGELAQRFGHR